MKMKSSIKKKYKETEELFKSFLYSRKLKLTRQRIDILKEFFKSEKHLTADDLYLNLRKKHPEIGRTTVYRTMKLICSSGIANEIFLNDRISKYELRLEHSQHVHLICVNCGKVYDIKDEEIEKLQKKISKAHSFEPIKYRLEILGYCERCSEREYHAGE